MTSTGSFPKRIARAFSDDSTIAFDLVSHLTYMSVLATARASRERLLELSVNMPYRTREAFQRVLNMVRRLGFEHVRAFQLVAAATQIEALKGILSRFAGSIVSGGNEAVFLQQETVVAMERYMAQYERAVEALKKWTDGYAALLVSAALVVVVGIISTLMYAISPLFIAGMGAGMIGFVLVGVYVIWRSAPVEVKTYDANGGPFIRRLSRRLLILGLPLGAAGAYILSRRYGLGGALLSLGVALLPSGLCAFLDDSRVDRIDRDLPNLLRSLGARTTSLGSTLAAALEKIDRKAMGSLEKPIRRLHGRLIFRLDPAACWDRFFQETGSQLAFRTGRPLVDGIRMGGLAEKVGETCSTFALQNVLLRSKRQMVADTFMYLTIPPARLHGRPAPLRTADCGQLQHQDQRTDEGPVGTDESVGLGLLRRIPAHVSGAGRGSLGDPDLLADPDSDGGQRPGAEGRRRRPLAEDRLLPQPDPDHLRPVHGGRPARRRRPV